MTDQLNSKIFVLITSYQCEAQIGRVLAQFDEKVAPWFGEIAVIDNRSSDDTVPSALSAFEKLRPLAQRHSITLTIIQNKDNVNLGGSHKSGFNYARSQGYQYVMVIHGDDQANLHDLLPELISGRYKNYDALLGSRFMKGARRHGYGRFRLYGNYVFLALFTAYSGRGTLDIGSGLNFYGPAVINSNDHTFAADNLAFNCYFLLKMYAKRRRLHFFPITWREEDQSSNARLFRQAWEIFKILNLYKWQKNKFLHSFFGTHRNLDDYKYNVINQECFKKDTSENK
jgi:hypothetical protein